MTERLYYHDSYLTTFDARIEAVENDTGVTRLRLDRSAFYPTSGGQPHDLGSLDHAQVTEVIADEDSVWHVLSADAPVFSVGSSVRGEIDWARRYDLMQQHSGQHLLSQVFVRLFGWETVSVHMGLEESTLDLDTPAITAEEVQQAQQAANQIAWEARPVKVYFLKSSDIDRVPLRRAPKVTGTVRIVEIADYDWSACGGTHVATTAELAPVLITRSERRRGGVRLTFLCGGRALREITRTRALLGETAALFSTDPTEVPVLVTRLMERAKESQREVETLRQRLLQFDAQSLLAAAETIGDMKLVCAQRDDLDGSSLRTLASSLVANAHVVALLASVQEGKTLLVFARALEGTPASLHMGNLLRDALVRAGAKGGGRPDFAQGGGVDAEFAPSLLSWARDQLSAAASGA